MQYYFTGQRLQSFSLFGTINKAKDLREQCKKRRVGEGDTEKEGEVYLAKRQTRGVRLKKKNKSELGVVVKQEGDRWERGQSEND